MRWLSLVLLSLAPAPLAAHPHVFVDTGVEMIFDEGGRLTHLRVTWAYDEFYSLMLLEEMGLDRDMDGVLTEAEEAQLSGFDAQWVEGFNGDTVARLGREDLTLSGPMEPTATAEAGRIVSSHLRAVEGAPRLAGRVLSVLPYDETFYTAYEVTRPVTLRGRPDCAIEKIVPDIDAKLAQMRDMLLRIDENADLEENDIPLVGAEFATEIRVTCPVS